MKVSGIGAKLALTILSGASGEEQLNAKLKEMEKENEAQLKKYQKSLEKIEVELEQIRENSEEMSEDE